MTSPYRPLGFNSYLGDAPANAQSGVAVENNEVLKDD